MPTLRKNISSRDELTFGDENSLHMDLEKSGKNPMNEEELEDRKNAFELFMTKGTFYSNYHTLIQNEIYAKA